MPLTTGYNVGEAQLLITLSGFAYLDSTPLPDESVAAQEARMRHDIDAALAASAYPTWRVVWGPGLSGDRANMLYVAGDPAINQMAVAVRGTDWSFWLDWVENFASLLPLVPFTAVVPSIPAGTPLIAAGTNLGLQLLLSSRGSTGGAGEVDLATFLSQTGQNALTFITGHSLGGCLASVLAPTLAQQLGSSISLKVYTFAAPSAGNKDFADYCDQLFTDATTGTSTSYRVYNDLDIVPMSWATLPAIGSLYAPAPACTDALNKVIVRAQEAVRAEYRQPGSMRQGSAVPLHGQVAGPAHVATDTDALGNIRFFAEVGEQHATETYMQLLAAPVVTTALAKLRGVQARLLARAE